MKDERKYVSVEIIRYEERDAYCHFNAPSIHSIKDKWLEGLVLKRESLEAQGLRVGDTFQWIPRKDGIVRTEDILQHPNRLSEEDDRNAREVTARVQQYLKKSRAVSHPKL